MILQERVYFQNKSQAANKACSLRIVTEHAILHATTDTIVNKQTPHCAYKSLILVNILVACRAELFYDEDRPNIMLICSIDT